MDLSLSSPRPIRALAMAILFFVIPVYGQISTPCSSSMLTSLTPCMNFLTNSTANGTSPSSDCCTSLRSLTSGGRDCLCLIVTGNVPLQIPINRTLAISLPRACNMPGVPVQCKAAGAPIPSPGPISLSPGVSPSSSPEASLPSQPVTPSQAPEADNTFLTPPSSVDSEAPTSTTGSRPVLTPSTATSSYSFSGYLLLLPLVYALFKTC